ncbi:MAG: glycosyltransferase [Verrucomicrobia bacterium]|nr:glycosyltransferase [Verrucomicrobiota bacterium]
MRMLYLHDQSTDDGMAAIIQVLHMCQAFADHGVTLQLALPGHLGDDRRHLAAAEALLGKPPAFTIVHYPKITLAGRFSMIGGMVGAQRLVRRIQTDVCFTRNPTYLSGALAVGLPTVFESHDTTIHDNRLWNTWWTRRLLAAARQPKLVKFVTISQALADVWQARGVPSQKLLPLHDGAVPAPAISVAEQPALRQRLGLPQNRKIALYAGSLYPNRGIERLYRLAPTLPHVQFVIIGGPDDRADYYRQLATQSQLANVSVLGRVPHADVKHYLAAADVLLMIWTSQIRTIYHCSPMKVFEYMAAGRPIVGDGFPTVREVLTDGESALLITPENDVQLKTKLEQALAMTIPNAMTEKARTLLAERYTWSSRARAILDSLDAIRTKSATTEPRPAHA